MKPHLLLCLSLAALISCKNAPAPADTGATKSCARYRGDEVCCRTGAVVPPTVYDTRESCEREPGCGQALAALGANLATQDLLVTTPEALGVTVTAAQPATSLGDEWKVYQGVTVRCQAKGRETFTLKPLVSEGGGQVRFVGAVEKLAGAEVSCGCSAGPTS